MYELSNFLVEAGYMKDAFTGEPITRTKQSHPYSYQPFEVFSTGEEPTSSMYSDRMMQWDFDKFENCCMEVWGNEGQMFFDRTPNEIEKFLQLYTGFDSLKLTRIVECCNQATGYPLWFFAFSVTK